MELIVYAAALGVAASLLVPLLYSFVSGFLPTTLTTGANIPTSYPTTAQSIITSILLWGVFLGGALWLVSLFGPAGRAIRENA